MKSLRTALADSRCDKIPPNWLTRDQVADREKVCADVATKLISRALASQPPLLERREFRVRWGNQVRPRPFHRYL